MLLYILQSCWWSIITICGFRDDLTQLRPVTKLALQLIALAILIIPNELQIENLYGFLGIHNVPELLQYPITFLQEFL